MNKNHFVCIMAGGIGSRFWPMSRANYPKQFLDILNTGRTLIQSTFDRFALFVPKQNIYVVTAENYRDIVAEQLPGLPAENILCEPSRKNTAPCIAYNSYKLRAKNPEANLICAPVVSQLLAAEALKMGPGVVAPRIAELARVRSAVHEALDALGDLVSFPRTEGAFYVLMKLPGVTDALAFNRAMVERHKVATIPGFAFGLTDTASANYQRLSYGALDAATVAEGVQRFVAAVRDWYRA